MSLAAPVLPLAIADVIEPSTRHRILIVSDTLGAPLHRFLLRALRRARRARTCAVRVVHESALKPMTAGEVADALAARLAEFAPDVVVLAQLSGVHATALAKGVRNAGIPLVALLYRPRGEAKSSWLDHADALLASTAELAARARDSGSTPVETIAPCGHAADFRPEGSRLRHDNPDRFTIGLVAGRSGEAGERLAGPIAELLAKHGDLRFEMFGGASLPAELARFGRRVAHHRFLGNYEAHMAYLNTLGWDLALVSATDDPALTPAEWIEHSIAGIPVLASNAGPFAAIGAAGAAALVERDDWAGAIPALMNDRARLAEMVSSARALIAAQYSPVAMEKRLHGLFARAGAEAFASPPPATGPRRALVILGMHRSGTSMLTRMCALLGARTPTNLSPPAPDNPEGFWESFDIGRAHDSLLVALGSSWDDFATIPRARLAGPSGVQCVEEIGWVLDSDMPDAPLFALKDPRACRLLPLWDRVLEDAAIEPLFLLVFRDPAEVAASLARRNGFNADKSHLLWLRHVIDAERGTRGRKRCVVDFASLRADWRLAARRIGDELGVKWPVPIETAAPAIDGFVRPSAKRARETHPALDSRIAAWTSDVHAALLAVERGEDNAASATIDRVAAELAEREIEMARFGLPRAADLAEEEPGVAPLARLRREAQWNGQQVSVLRATLQAALTRETALAAQLAGSAKPLERKLLASRQVPVGARHYRAYVGPADQYDFMGATQFRLLTALGLREEHYLLDLGCGSLRAGKLLIAYLLPGHYCGLEPNRWLIDDAIASEIGDQFIALNRPKFLHSEDFDLAAIDAPPDFVVAQSIFSHSGRDMVEAAFASVARVMPEHGQFLFTMIDEACPRYPELAAGDATQGWEYPGCVSYPAARIGEFAAACGLLVERLDWFHPRQSWYRAVRDEAMLMRNQQAGLDRGGVLFDERF